MTLKSKPRVSGIGTSYRWPDGLMKAIGFMQFKNEVTLFFTKNSADFLLQSYKNFRIIALIIMRVRYISL